MARIVCIAGLIYATFAICALFAGSPDPDCWPEAAQTFIIVIAGAAVMMNADVVIAGMARSIRTVRARLELPFRAPPPASSATPGRERGYPRPR